jgi:hypothetical protein
VGLPDPSRSTLLDRKRKTGAGPTSRLSLRSRRILEYGEHLTVDQVKDADRWQADLEAERASLGVGWEDDLNPKRTFQLGLAALELTFTKLVPQLRDPVAVQRKLEYTLAPGLEWSVLCYVRSSCELGYVVGLRLYLASVSAPLNVEAALLVDSLVGVGSEQVS